MPTWPATLPQSPLLENYHEAVPDTVLRTDMDQGPAKLRQRTTAAVRTLAVNFLLSKTQVAALEDFYLTTLQGVASFGFTHPRTGAAISCRFVRPPEYATTNGNFFKAAVELEILP